MSRRCIAILMLACALSLFAKVRVLTVCVGTYPEGAGWSNISARNDSRSIRALFPDAVSLVDEGATRQAFGRQLARLQNDAAPGDTVIIHFSGHGQQMLTPASAFEPDRVDEALVPYDARQRETGVYRGQNHFTDDAFGQQVRAIRERVGRQGLVIVVIDACHSDSMDKDADGSDDLYRGTEEIFGAENLSPDSIAALREHYYQSDDSAVEASEQMADAIFIGACGTHQRNYEIKVNGEGHGSLTFYFCKAVSEKGLADTEAMLSALYSEMSADNVMKFHGQQPNIRTSVGWKASAAPVYQPTADVADDEQASSDFALWIIVGIAAMMILIIAIAIWKRKR